MFRENECRAASIRTLTYRDCGSGKLYSLVYLCNCRVIPFCNLSQENARVSIAGKFKIFDPRKIVGQYNASRGSRNEYDAFLDGSHLIVLHRGIARAKCDQFLRKLLDTGS